MKIGTEVTFELYQFWGIYDGNYEINLVLFQTFLRH